MPETFGLLLLQAFPSLGVAAVNAFGFAGAGLAFLAAGTAVTIGISLGVSALANAIFNPQTQRSAPKPEDVQQSYRQNTAPRIRHYGKTKVSGPWAFGGSNSGNFHKVVVLGHGEIHAIDEYWIDDRQVALDGSGIVAAAPYNSKLKIETRPGSSTQTYYSNLESAFSEWTSTHVGKGIASLYSVQYAVDSADFYSTFPNAINTQYRVVARWQPDIVSQKTGATGYSDNAADIIADYMKHPDGMRLPSSLLTTTQAAALLEAAYDRANEDVTLKAGGTEKRYRLWGSYSLDERPADVLARMLAACDARLVPTSDGGIGLDIGTWTEPSVVLDETAIVGFSELSRGRDVLSTANTISATFTDPDSDYQTTEADPWVDATDVSARGEIKLTTSFIMSPSHGQTRRLMKLASYRANPSWIGTFQFNLKGLAAIGERFVRIQYPLFSINEVFEVQDFRINIGENNLVSGVTMQLQSMPQTAYNWNAATEEGTAPSTGTTTEESIVPVPTNFNVVMTSTPTAILSWDTPSTGLTVEVQVKLSSDSEWTALGVTGDSVETGALTADANYDFRIRNKSLTSQVSDWNTLSSIIASTDTTTTGPATGESATGGVGQVQLDWTSPNANNYVATKIYRNTINDFGSSTLVWQEYGPKNTADTYTDTGLSAGNFYYWLVARNARDLNPDTEVATGSVTVS